MIGRNFDFGKTRTLGHALEYCLQGWHCYPVNLLTLKHEPCIYCGQEHPMSLTLPLYQCHKQVRAAEIISVDPTIRRIQVSVPAGEEDPNVMAGHTIMVDAAWLERFQPQPGMYLVEYAGGYRSVSPATEFVEGYEAIDEDQANEHWAPKNDDAPDPDGKPATGGTPLAQPAPEPQAKSSGLSHDESQGGF